MRKVKSLAETSESDLDMREQLFVELITTPDENGQLRTVTRAAEEAGYNPTYGRAIRHKPKIAKAVMARCAEMEAENAEGAQLVLRRLTRDAMAGDNTAAAILMRALGRGGNNVSLSVGVSVGYQDKLNDALAKRGLVFENEPSDN